MDLQIRRQDPRNAIEHGASILPDVLNAVEGELAKLGYIVNTVSLDGYPSRNRLDLEISYGD